MTDHDTWRVRLVPPPGGFDRLAHALSRPSRARRIWMMRTAITTACSFSIAVALAVHVHNAPRRAFERALHVALAEAQRKTSTPIAPPSRELPSSRPDVRIVLVEALPGARN